METKIRYSHYAQEIEKKRNQVSEKASVLQ